MEQNLEKKIDFKEKLFFFFTKNKLKLIISFFLILSIGVFLIFFKFNSEKKNNLISEQFIQAGINLDLNKTELSKKIYSEIIFKKNKFYSVLALNIILEKKLETDENTILSYFKIIENLKLPKEKKDLVTLKKALFLIEKSKTTEANKILNNLIENDSKFKDVAQEILAN
tara:strand:- start:217 stop:726 length:510 start_codon:yes stop_codon:yes gene_type:complete